MSFSLLQILFFWRFWLLRHIRRHELPAWPANYVVFSTFCKRNVWKIEPAAEQRAIVDRDLQEEHGHQLKCDIRYFKLWFGLKLANNTSKTTQAYSFMKAVLASCCYSLVFTCRTCSSSAQMSVFIPSDPGHSWISLINKHIYTTGRSLTSATLQRGVGAVFCLVKAPRAF